MKKIFLSISICFFTTQILGQQLWIRETPTDMLISIQRTFNGEIALAGRSDSGVFLAITDTIGNIQWAKKYFTNHACTYKSFVQTRDSGFVILGSSPDIFILKVDKAGNIVWSQILATTVNLNYLYMAITYSDDGGVVIAVLDGNTYLCHINQSGNLIWSYSYKAWSQFSPPEEDFLVTNVKGNYIFLTSQYIGVNGSIALTKIDTAGNLIMSKSYDYNSERWSRSRASIVNTLDDGILIKLEVDSPAGHWGFPDPVAIQIFKTDSSGEVNWAREYRNDGLSCWPILKGSNFKQEYFFASSYPGASYNFITKIDSVGNIDWSKGILHYVRDGIIFDDGSIMTAGSRGSGNTSLIRSDINGNSCGHYISNIYSSSLSIDVDTINPIRTTISDSLIPLAFTSDTGFTLTTTCSLIGIEEQYSPANIIKLFPNPFHISTMLTSEIRFHEALLKIYNSLGILVRTEKNLEGGSYILHRQTLPEGLYFFELISTESQFYSAGKFIIE